MLNLSAGGCMIETDAPVHMDDIYHLQLLTEKNQPPLELGAIVRSINGKRVGLKFLPSTREDQHLLALLRTRAEAPGDRKIQPV